jgi:taurine dioxygenase
MVRIGSHGAPALWWYRLITLEANVADNYKSIEVRPVGSFIGAEIGGVDVANLADEQFEEIRRAFIEYGVIFFRQQKITPQQQVDFAQRWGEINVNRFFQASEEHPLIAEVRKEPDNTMNIGATWHTDHSYDLAPAMGSILYAREVPPVGGDTLFASMHAAWMALSDGLKQTLEGLHARHSSRHVFGLITPDTFPDLVGRIGNAHEATQDAVHKVVIRHPDSGKEILYVNPQFTVGIEGWAQGESDALLGYLYQHAAKPEFTCRFRWEEGSMAIWDNRATWHCALNDYQGHRRLMHRITLEGVELEGATDPQLAKAS